MIKDYTLPPHSQTSKPTTDGAERKAYSPIPPILSSLLSIILRARLGRQLQRLGRILLGHEQLHELEFPCGSELRVIE